MTNELGRVFTRRLLEELQARAWTPTDLAREVGVSPSTVTRNLRSETFPAPATIMAYAEALKISPMRLLCEASTTTRRLAEWLADVDREKLRTVLPAMALALGKDPPDID